MRINAEQFHIPCDQLRNLIDQWIFDERARAMLKRKLCDHVRFDPLSEEFGLSVQQTKKIVYRYMERLLEHIER